MYACVVKNSNDTWDVWSIFANIPNSSRKERIDNALKSGFPIVGKNLTKFGTSVKSGAIWDGTKFNGGEPSTMLEGSLRGLYSYLCNNMIILTCIGQPNTELDEQMKAVFESETTLIKIPENQTAKIGDVWDGKNIITI